MKKALFLCGALLFGGCVEALAAPPVSATSQPSTTQPALTPPTKTSGIDRSLSTGVVPFGDIQLQLELGQFTVQEIDDLIKESRQENRDAAARVAFFMEKFAGTKFEYESQLPIPALGVLRIRLESFGCTGFVIYMLALASAHDFEEFANNVRELRYWKTEARGVNSDPAKGNILDFAYDIFISSGEARGFVKNVTKEVAGDNVLTKFKTRFTSRRRSEEYDANNQWIVPKVSPNKVVSAKMILRWTFRQMDRSKIKTGDILLFSRVDPEAEVGEELMVGHMGIALNIDGEIYLMHATRDYMWRPEATKDTPPSATGVYYEDDPRREQLGVTVATNWVIDPLGRQSKIDNKMYYGYHPTEKRTLSDYLSGAHINGVMVLRPIERSKETKDKE